MTSFYVSLRGNDHWSGKLPGPNRAGTDGPFATIGRAQRAVRGLKKKGELPAAVRVELRGGVYELSEPLKFAPRDSGTPPHIDKALHVFGLPRDVTYAAYPRERPVLSGGIRIGGWKETTVHAQRAWVATLPQVARGEWSFTQLWVNGRRAPRTRLPRTGYFRIEELLGKVEWLDWDPDNDNFTGLMTGQNRFRFAAADLQDWRNITDIEFVGLHYWIESRIPFARINTATREARLQWKSQMRLSDDHTGQGAQYYVENIFEELNKPGQWYLDRPSGRLYYLPLPEERIKNSEIVAPRLAQLLIVQGEARQAAPVENIVFEGLTFSHSEWPSGAISSTVTPQAACHVPGALSFRHARNCALRDCTLAHLGSYGVDVCEESYDVKIVGNRISDLAGGGVKVWHTYPLRRPPGEIPGRGPDQSYLAGCRRIHITDNEIADGGYRWRQAVGVLIGKCSSNEILYNHIHDFDYSGISVGWTWGYHESHGCGNIIEHNHLHHIGRGVLSDLGAIYTLGVAPGTRIRYNLIHDVTSRGYGGWGIYLDGGSSQVLVESNVVYRTKCQGFQLSAGRDNVVCNNIFAYGGEGQLIRGFMDPQQSFVATRNIFLQDSEVQTDIVVGTWKELWAIFDFNLYCDLSGKPLRFDAKTWKQWQGLGADQHSLVADPLFVNPAKGDFRLRPNSPALKIGFVPFEVEVGPRDANTR